MVQIDRRLFAQFDWALLLSALIIPTFGLVVLYSAGYSTDGSGISLSWLPITIRSEAFAKQLVFISAGLVVILFGALIPPSFWHRYSYFLLAVCIGLLLGVLAFGTVVNGSRRWLTLPGFRFQPAEMTKLAVVFAMARFLSKRLPSRGGYSFREVIPPALVLAVPMALIMLQPDLGTALAVGGIGGMMILFMGVRPKVLMVLACISIVGVIAGWESLHDYQKKRVLTFVDPETDPKGSGYHITQSKIAVGSGELFGKGYFNGTQTQLEFLPEHTTDFIFSVLGEEWGFVGCLVVVSLYLLFLYQVLRLVSRTRDVFSALVVFGLGAKVFFHAVINIGMVIGLFPVVGIPLPLFSYGGSSIISNMFAIGVMLSVSMRRFAFSGK